MNVVGSSGGLAGATAAAASASSSSLSSSSSQLAWTWEHVYSFVSQRHPLFQMLTSLPGSGVVWRYIKSSHQNDPARTLLELLLALFVVYTWLKSRTRGDKNGKNFVKLSEKEIDELVMEWQPEPLVWEDPEASALPSPPVVVGPPSLHSRVVVTADGDDQSDAVLLSSNPAANAKDVLNLASSNFSGLALNEKVKEKAIECLRGYGVGSCGPSGFYGFFDVHIELENALAAFLGVEASIIYPQGFTTVCSAIPSFAKRGDIIVADRRVNFAIQKGIQISRSHVRWYEHNDMDSLEAVLETIDRENKRTKAPLTRRFIVTEGLFEGDGQIADLPRLVSVHNHKPRVYLSSRTDAVLFSCRWSSSASTSTG